MTQASQAPRPARARTVRRPLHGVLLLDKPLGLSSNDALQKAKWLLRAEKAGHTGTLDPLATGLLPLCFGAATKFSQVSLDAAKEYVATVRLGVRTSTGDREGEVLETRPVDFDATRLEAVLAQFRGAIAQVPPAYSALKHEGKPLYVYARAGVAVEREARTVHIQGLTAEWSPGAPDRMELRVRCSKGTYIRTLAEDLGTALGCGASLLALRRVGSGPLSIGAAVTLEALEALADADRTQYLLPVDALLQDWPSVHLTHEDAGRFLSGMRRRLGSDALPPDGSRVRVYGPPATRPVLLGSAHCAAGELIPDRLLSPLEIQSLQAAA